MKKYMDIKEIVFDFNGQAFYPGDAPIPAHKIFVDRESIFDIFCKKERTPDEEELVKSYVVYYMKAPGFDLSFLNGGVDIKNLSTEQLIDLCLDNGIDPF